MWNVVCPFDLTQNQMVGLYRWQHSKCAPAARKLRMDISPNDFSVLELLMHSIQSIALFQPPMSPNLRGDFQGP
jgi:hypothetical protein